jgi:hypothetical protein
MRKTYLAIAVLTMALFAFSAPATATTYYLDCSVASSGNGTSWGTAWKALSNITGLNPGDLVYISGSSSCSNYSTSQWTPINGTVGNPIIYRVAQDTGHTSPVTITLSGPPGLQASGGTFQGVWIDGNFGGKINMSINGLLGSAGSTAINGLHFSYLTMNNTTIEATTVQNFQLEHSSATVPCGKDHFFTSGRSVGAISYTTNSIHDNTIVLCQVNDGSGHGSDGFQWIENVSFYNNVVYWVFNSTANGQHADGIQTGGSYVAIYDNYFENAGNYPVYGDLFGSASHWRIYNNVFTEFSGHGSGISGQAMGIGFEGSYGASMNDFGIANNTCYAEDSNHSCADLNGGASGNNITNSYLVNNLGYNTGNEVTVGSGGSITQSNNFSGTSGVSFVDVAAYPTGNWQLQAGSTSAIGQGLNPAPSYLTSVYATDKAGNTRTNPWDIGGYQYNSVPPVAPPTNLSAVVQ